MQTRHGVSLFWGGRFWELLETRYEIEIWLRRFWDTVGFSHTQSGERNPDFTIGTDENGVIIPTGFFDPLYVNDLEANAVGSWAGVNVTSDRITQHNIDDVIAYLNNPALYKVPQQSHNVSKQFAAGTIYTQLPVAV